MSRRHSSGSSRSESPRPNCRKPASDMRIVDVRQGRESSDAMQGVESTKAVYPAKSVEPYKAESSAITAPPWEEAVAGTNRQPAKAAPSSPAKSDSESEATPEYKKRNISWRPERTVEASAPHRSRPPCPRAAVPHPASVVIRSPAPRLGSDPRPAVIRLVHPVAVTIRSPVIRLIRHPHLTVIRRVLPTSVRVQIFRPYVILIRVVPGIRIVDHAVAVAIPPVPVVALGSRSNFVARIGAGSAHRCHVTLLDVSDALRGSQLRFTFAHDDYRVAIGPHFNAVHSILVRRMQSNVRSVDLRLCLTFAKHRVIDQPLPNLHLNVSLGKIREGGLRVRTQAKNVGKIELHLSAPARTG